MQTKSSSYIQYAVPILAYCISSISMTVVNKVVLSAYKFKMNFLLLMFQVCIELKKKKKKKKKKEYRGNIRNNLLLSIYKCFKNNNNNEIYILK